MPVKKKKGVCKKKVGKGIYQTVANRLTGSKIGPGEIHAPQYTKKGFKMGSYIGPRTELYKNIKKGKKPVSKTDEASMLHDLSYDKATSAADVRRADIRMVRKLKEMRKNKTDGRFNTTLGIAPIRAKMFLEDLGIMKKGSFAGIHKGVDKENKAVNASEIARLKRLGYGKKPQKGSGKRASSKWLEHVKAVKNKNVGMKFSDVLKLSSSSYKK